MNLYLPNAFLIALVAASLVVEHLWCVFLQTQTGLKYFADIPNARSSHQKIVPRAAGAPFALGLSLASTFAIVSGQVSALTIIPLCLAYLMLGSVGVLDDLRGLTARARLLAQIASSLLLLVSFLVAHSGQIEFGMSTLVALLLWLIFSVGSINLFNFADGINGFVSISALLSLNIFYFFSPLELRTPFQTTTLVMSLALAPMLVVFIFHNFVRRRVFMGDGGSTVLGLWQSQFGLALFELFATQGTTSSLGDSTAFIFGLAALVALGCAVWIFADCGTMVVVKFLLRVPLSQPHREHCYQRLSRHKNWGHARATLFIVSIEIAVLLVINSLYANLYAEGETMAFALSVAAFLFTIAVVFFMNNWRAFRRLQGKES